MKHSKTQDHPATIGDVARVAGVSIATVSRVINQSDQVRPATHARVSEAMIHLGFVVNPIARSLRGAHNDVLGVVVSDVSNPYAAEVVRGIDAEIAVQHYHLLLYTTARQKAKESSFITTLTQGLADGLIVIVPRSNDTALLELARRHFPHVVVDNRFDTYQGHAIGFEYRQGAMLATRYLLQLGHRRIGFIAGRNDIIESTERFAGYRAALTEQQLPFIPSLVQEGDLFQPSGFRCTQNLLALPEPPTAIFAANDAMAFGALDAIRERGLRVPDDISVIGFGDFPQAVQIYPALTTIRQHMFEAGQLAARTLFAVIQQPDYPVTQTILKAELIERGTCRAIIL